MGQCRAAFGVAELPGKAIAYGHTADLGCRLEAGGSLPIGNPISFLLVFVIYVTERQFGLDVDARIAEMPRGCAVANGLIQLKGLVNRNWV